MICSSGRNDCLEKFDRVDNKLGSFYQKISRTTDKAHYYPHKCNQIFFCFKALRQQKIMYAIICFRVLSEMSISRNMGIRITNTDNVSQKLHLHLHQ